MKQDWFASIARFEPLGTFNKETWSLVNTLLEVKTDEVIDRYHPASNAIGHFASADDTYSWCRKLPTSQYNKIVVMPGCRLIDTAWSRDWLHNIICGLDQGGQLILPFRVDGRPSEPVGLAPWQLENLLGKPTQINDSFAAFLPIYCDRKPRSIAGCFMADPIFWLGQLAEYLSEERMCQLTAEVWRSGNSTWNICNNEPLERLTADFLSESFSDLARYLVFAVQGINTKSYSIQRIFDQIFGENKDLTWADLGSGSGFLGIEMAIQSPIHVINFDKSLAQSRLGVDMMQQLAHVSFVGKCSMVTSRLESTDLPGELDVVSMLTTLCYVPKESQAQLLRRCWNSLRPGGALIILENLKSKAYTRDFDLMFEENELQVMLNDLGGQARYFHALTGLEMSAAQSASKTCYQVRIKL